MNKFYNKYINAFLIFARMKLDKSTSYHELARFALSLHEKARLLIQRASKNPGIHIQKLSREMAEYGKVFIRKFADRFRRQKQAAEEESFHAGNY